MDVTKLFEISSDKLEPLSSTRLDAMIETALTQPQSQPSLKVPANQNSHFIKRALAVAAALAIVITVSLQLAPQVSISTAIDNDAYDEISEMLIIETLNDLG